MGQTLSAPATDKHSKSGADERFAYAISEMQGWRITMEDAHAAVLALEEGVENPDSFFAVYDGHGGGAAAKFAGENVHRRLITEEAYKQKQYEEALKRAFLGTDEDILADPTHSRDPSGCTAVAALLTGDGKKIYVANAGDSRSVISVKGEAKPLSFDHKPSNESEKARISAAGGYIEYGRVNGNLALSRAIGDFDFKKNYSLTPEKQVITADPDVTVHDVTDEDEFLIMACDGIWDCLSSQQVIDFVRLKVSEGVELTEICEQIFEHCLAPDTSSGAGIGCDNMTILIVALLNGRTKEEWYSWITDRVKNKYGYETPSTIPQIYAQSRLMAFKARREAMEERDRIRSDRDFNSGGLAGTTFGGFARILGSAGGISFDPTSGLITGGSMMFGHDDSDEEDIEGDEMDTDGDPGHSFFSNTLGLGGDRSGDATSNLKAQLRDLDIDNDDEENDSDEAHLRELQGEAPQPPRPQPNGDIHAVDQLKSQPGGDEPSPAVKAEGLLDGSEDPSKVT